MKNTYLNFLVFALVGNATIGLLSLGTIRKDQDWVAHTFEVRSVIGNTLQTCLDAESNYRGYLISENDGLFDTYSNAYKSIPYNLKKLDLLIRDNPTQVRHLMTAKDSIDYRFKLSRDTIAALKRNEREKLVPAIVEGKKRMDAVKLAFSNMRDEEDRLMDRRMNEVQRAYHWMVANVLGFCTLVMIALGIVVLTQNKFRRQESNLR